MKAGWPRPVLSSRGTSISSINQEEEAQPPDRDAAHQHHEPERSGVFHVTCYLVFLASRRSPFPHSARCFGVPASACAAGDGGSAASNRARGCARDARAATGAATRRTWRCTWATSAARNKARRAPSIAATGKNAVSRTSNIQNKPDILQYIMTNESQNQASTFQSRRRPYCTAQRRDDAEHIYASGPNVFPSIRSMPWLVGRKSLRTPQW